MNEFVDIIVIYIVLRAILAFLGAWWHGCSPQGRVSR